MNLVVLLVIAVALVSAPAQAQVIMTVAGGAGSSKFCGDGAIATKACLSLPSDVAVDAAGNLLIADTGHDRIRKVDATGMITTVAGNGTTVFCGDGGPATSACLARPEGLAVDAAGNIFVTSAGRVRKIDLAGSITTVAGNGSASYCGDGTPATGACLNSPEGVSVDGAGNLYIADALNHRVRKVDVAGTITTVAGNGTSAYCGDDGPATLACLSLPMGVAVDGAGNLLIADAQNDRIRKVGADGTITTIAGTGVGAYCGDDGFATSACLWIPERVAVDADNNVFIADFGNSRVRKVDAGGMITTVAGTTHGFCGDGGPATDACLASPRGVLLDHGALIVADTRNYRIRKVDIAFLTHPASSLSGCLKTSALITIAAPAPVGGIVVTLSSDHPNVTVPATVKISAGALSRAFSVNTKAVASEVTATISAVTSDWTRTIGLTLTPMGPKKVALAPNPVVGGGIVSGTVTLECAAGPGDVAITLASTKPSIALPGPLTLTIPFGEKVGMFSVTTAPVASRTTAGITATANDVMKKQNLVVNPVP